MRIYLLFSLHLLVSKMEHFNLKIQAVLQFKACFSFISLVLNHTTYLKNNITMNKQECGFIKSINIVFYISISKEKSHTIISRDSNEALMNIQYPFLIQAISKPKPDHGSISLLRMLFICISHVLDLFSTSLIFSPPLYLYWAISFEFC